jgi:hydroxymethylpyrimidine/phosphomethylpyrimidine kinase
MTTMQGRVLIVAGSDSGGGAGIQADIKTVTCLGGYAMTAVTALTAQNTRGVDGVQGVDPAFIKQQMQSVLDDIGADCIKTGMLHDDPTIEAVGEILNAYPEIPVVVDPVMVSQSGAPLLDPESVRTLNRVLMPHADVITPNVPEAERLSGMDIRTSEDLDHAAQTLITLGVPAALVKGGHLRSDTATDVLATRQNMHVFEGPRLDTKHTHGTGCTLASGIAASLAQGHDLFGAVERARAYLLEALRTAPGYGHGNGPLNHAVTVRDFQVDL